jgi:hypothetical protein
MGSLKNLLKIHKARKAQISKLPDNVQNQVYKKHRPRGKDGVIEGGTVFTCVYIWKYFKDLLKNY